MADLHTGYAIQAALSRCNCTLNPKPSLNCNGSKITIIVLSRAILQQHTEVHTGSFSCNYTKHSVTSTSHSRIPFKFCTCTQLCNRKHPKKQKQKSAMQDTILTSNTTSADWNLVVHTLRADLRRTKILQINQE